MKGPATWLAGNEIDGLELKVKITIRKMIKSRIKIKMRNSRRASAVGVAPAR
jgi:hypothetical protein